MSDPEAFRPERFEPGREEQKNKFAYPPFNAGPRICLGANFAMIESQIIVGTIVARRVVVWHEQFYNRVVAIVSVRE